MTIEELAQRAGVPVRTVRYYIAEGIIPGAESRGKAAAYGQEHLVKLLLARKLAERRVLLADIKDQLCHLTLEEAQALLESEEQQERALRPSGAASPREFISYLLARARGGEGGEQALGEGQVGHPLSQRAVKPLARTTPAASEPPPPSDCWRRVELGPGLELHIRSDAETPYANLIRRLIEQARRYEPSRRTAPSSHAEPVPRGAPQETKRGT
ncbi:MAG: MerR family transcriptional regulator [Anaerolineae bacterium]|nr:MerR family transcriptional regulator [Anaerolineae bacterium]